MSIDSGCSLPRFSTNTSIPTLCRVKLHWVPPFLSPPSLMGCQDNWYFKQLTSATRSRCSLGRRKKGRDSIKWIHTAKSPRVWWHPESSQNKEVPMYMQSPFTLGLWSGIARGALVCLSEGSNEVTGPNLLWELWAHGMANLWKTDPSGRELGHGEGNETGAHPSPTWLTPHIKSVLLVLGFGVELGVLHPTSCSFSVWEGGCVRSVPGKAPSDWEEGTAASDVPPSSHFQFTKCKREIVSLRPTILC